MLSRKPVIWQASEAISRHVELQILILEGFNKGTTLKNNHKK